MPAAGDKKRKKNDSGKASPAKKRKVEPKKDDKKKTTKKPAKVEPAKAKKAAPVSKVKKSTDKGTKAKQTDTKSKAATKTAQKNSSSKKSEKDTKKATNTSATKSKTEPKKVSHAVQKKSSRKPVPQKTEKSKTPVVKSKGVAVKPASRVTLKTTAASKKAQATVAKAKLKAAKSLAKPKQVQTKKEPVKAKTESKPKAEKPETKTEKEKKSEEKPKEVKKKIDVKPTPKKEPEKSPVKRKTTSEVEPADLPRKKRVITPNKRYADFETDTSPKRISELRAFVQDKKNTPATPKSEKQVKPTNQREKAPKAEASPVKKAVKTSDDSEGLKKSPEIKVIKASEMKPAEKLLKKLQKKLEREAKAAFAKPKQSPNKDTAKTKITKVVTYNKPAYSKFSKTEAKQLFPKEKTTKPAVIIKKKPTSNSNGEKVVKVAPKVTPKPTPKVAPSPKKFREQKKDDRKIQSKFLFQKDVRQADDANTNCWITGIDIYKSGEIVLVDMSNKKIKLFSASFEYMSQAKLDTTPQDISISPVDAGLAFFTKPFSKEGIQKVNMSDGVLTLNDSFLTNGTNRGVKCIKSGILTSVQNGRYHDLDINLFKIDLLDYKGNTLKSVSVDQNGIRLFKLPLYFTVSNNEKQIVVSDCIRNNSYILSLDMTGKIKFKFTGVRDNPITPRGLTTDDEDNLYVTEWERHNVYVLTPSGKRQQLLLDHTEQIKEGQDGLKKPYQLAFYKHENVGRLIVSQESCNTVKVFQLSQKQADQNGAAAEATTATVPETAKPAPTETSTKPTTPDTKVAVVKPVAKAPVTEEPPLQPAVTDSPSKATVVATSILSQEHAYTTLAPPDEKKTTDTVAVSADPLASDPVEEEGPEELSSIVDSIISNLNNRDSNTLLPQPGPVASEPSF